MQAVGTHHEVEVAHGAAFEVDPHVRAVVFECAHGVAEDRLDPVFERTADDCGEIAACEAHVAGTGAEDGLRVEGEQARAVATLLSAFSRPVP